MRRIIEKIIPALILFFACDAFSQQRDQVFAGARPKAMGEAFVAVADDGNTIYWNPAGLARMERIQASFAYSDLFGIAINNYYASFLSRLYFIPALTDYVSFGMDWLGIQNKDEEIDFHHHQFSFALAFKPPKHFPIINNFSLGFNAKYIEIGTQYEEITKLDADGWGWDVGILYAFNRLNFIPGSVAIGMMIHDATGTQVTHHTGVTETILSQNIRLGLSYRPFEELSNRKIPITDPVLALDIDDRIHLGMEFWLWRTIALRAGIQRDFHNEKKVTLSFGLGLKTNWSDLPETNVDYAFTDSPFLPNTAKQFSGSVIVKEDPRLIRIEGAHIKNVFASLYLSYGKPGASIGSIKIKNFSDDTIKTWIHLQENSYMQTPQADTVLIAGESSIDFPLRAIFKPEIFSTPVGRLTGEVKVFYEHKRQVYSSSAEIDFRLHGKNYLTWDDPVKAAAFVTIDHPFLENFVDQALDIVINNDVARWFRNNRMADAVKLYHALKAYGVKYRPDPETPFLSLADTQHDVSLKLDKIQYPSQLLNKQNRFGDCDDSSVLMASLLQSCGLPTALVSVPGHIFIMFDTGIIESKLVSLPVPSELFFKLKGTLWIPIETTMIQKSSFVEAWSTAADLLNQSSDEKCYEIVIISEAQNKYPPVSHSLIDSADKKIPVIPYHASDLEQEFKALDNLKDNYINSLEKLLSRTISDSQKVAPRNQYGVLLSENGDYQRARLQFQLALGIDSTFSPSWNNLGNIEFVTGNFDQAEKLYLKALKYEPFNSGTYLNLATLYQMMIDSTTNHADSSYYQQKSDESILKAAQILAGNIESAFIKLGFDEERLHGKADNILDRLKKRIEKVKKYVDQNFKKYQRKRKIQDVVFDRHGSKGRGELDTQRGNLLYWNYQLNEK